MQSIKPSQSDESSLAQAAEYLGRGASVIHDLKEIMLNVKGRITPEVFYNEIRPWLRGADGDPWHRPWVFEGSEEVEDWAERSEVSGASASQSPLIRALDIYLGIEGDGAESSYSAPQEKKSFQERMLSYMTLQHRSFLHQLRHSPRQLRVLVQQFSKEKGVDFPLVKAYNQAIKALKEFRDAHMIVVTLLVIGPARRAAKREVEAPTPALVMSGSQISTDEKGKNEMMMEKAFEDQGDGEKVTLKGTGGSDLVRFLKGVRDQTSRAYLQDSG